MKNYTIFTIIIYLFLSSINSYAQIAISNVNQIAKIKKGITYIVMKDPTSEKAKEFIDVYKNTWTFSKIEFIKYSEVTKYLSPDNAFLTIGGYVTNASFTKLYSNGSSKNGINYSNTHLYLELWTCNEEFFLKKKEKSKFSTYDKIQVARIELFTDFVTLQDPDNIYQADYDGDGHIRNWGPGILKNYIQTLSAFLNIGLDRKLYTRINNIEEMKRLKTETLYVPEYTLNKFNKFTGDESQKHTEKDLFSLYKNNYKIVSISELNQKILTDTKGFYYLIYIKSSTDKFVTVINSLTGELIYSTYSPMSYNISSNDIKAINDNIK